MGGGGGERKAVKWIVHVIWDLWKTVQLIWKCVFFFFHFSKVSFQSENLVLFSHASSSMQTPWSLLAKCLALGACQTSLLVTLGPPRGELFITYHPVQTFYTHRFHITTSCPILLDISNHNVPSLKPSTGHNVSLLMHISFHKVPTSNSNK